MSKYVLVAGFLVMAGAFAPQAMSAGITPQSSLRAEEVNSSLVQKTQGRYCRRWENECAERWGWRTRNFFRCVRGHGC